jgi:poly-gamma-glutamate synthesis protein (capsule biosynthesis protein)
VTGRSPISCFVAAGDIMLGDSATSVGFGFHSRYPRDATAAFSDLAPLLQRGDVVFGNLECPLARAGSGGTRYRADQMRGDPEYSAALRKAGFTAVSVANNHAMQHGALAFETTVQCLRDVGIASVGLRGTDNWCAAPVIQNTSAGLRVGLIGYCWRPRQYSDSPTLYAEGNPETVLRDVRRLRDMVDTVVVSLHWGEEFLDSPSAGEVVAARQIIDAGAAIVVGHHPHVVRPMERYGRGVICYSLGNIVTDMIWLSELRTGAVLECSLSLSGVADARVWATRVDESYHPVVAAKPTQLMEESVIGIAEPVYRAAAAKSRRRQRMALYGYVIRNVGRYRLSVLATLVVTTLRNKLSGLITVQKRQRR